MFFCRSACIVLRRLRRNGELFPHENLKLLALRIQGTGTRCICDLQWAGSVKKWCGENGGCVGSMRKILARRVSWVEAAATRRFYDGSASRCNPLFCNCNRLCLECQLEVDFFSQPGGGWVVELSCMVCVVGCYCVHISGSAEGRSSARHEFLNIYWAHGVVVSHPLRMRKALGSIPSVSISLDSLGLRHIGAVMAIECASAGRARWSKTERDRARWYEYFIDFSIPKLKKKWNVRQHNRQTRAAVVHSVL